MRPIAKATFYFVLWLLPALVVAAGYIVVADRTCPIEDHSPKQQGQQDKGPAGGHSDIDSDRNQGKSYVLSATLRVAEATPQKAEGSTQATKQESKPSRWVTKFFCEAKALDVALVLFTYCLVIVTGWLVNATIGLRQETATLATFAKQQAEDMKASIEVAREAASAAKLNAEAAISTERPNIGFRITHSGGTAPKGAQPYNFSEAFQFQLFNYGRTPATLLELRRDWKEIRNSTEMPPPLDPMVDRGEIFEAHIVITTDQPHSDGMKLRKVFPKATEPGVTPQNCRLWFLAFARYVDVFGNHYICGYTAYLKPGGNRWKVHGGSKYNYLRRERTEDIPPEA